MTEVLEGLSAWAPTIVDAAIKAALALGVTWICAIVLRRGPARVRQLLWGATLIGLLALPALTASLPEWRVPILPRGALEALAARPAAQSGAASSGLAPIQARTPDVTVGVAPSAAEGAAANAIPVASWLVALWGAGVLAVLGWQLTGLGISWRLARSAREIDDPAWLEQAREIARRLGLRRLPRLASSPSVDAPVTFGALRPVILIPSEVEPKRRTPAAATHLGHSWTLANAKPRPKARCGAECDVSCPPPFASGGEEPSLKGRELVLLHELVHVRRSDWLIQVVAQLACALYWMLPLAWLAHRRLVLEREMACDEEVLATGALPSDYASQLLGAARRIRRRSLVPCAALDMARPSQLEGRLMAILDPRTRRRVRASLIIVAVVAVLAAIPALAALQPWITPAAAEADADDAPGIAELVRRIKELHELVELEHDRVQLPEAEMRELSRLHEQHHRKAMGQHEHRIAELSKQIAEREEGHIARTLALREEIAALTRNLPEGERERQEREHTLQQLQQELSRLDAAFQDETEGLHAELHAIHEQVESEVHDLEPIQQEMERVHAEMERRMEALEPLHEELEQIHHELEKRVQQDVLDRIRTILERHGVPVTPAIEGALSGELGHVEHHWGFYTEGDGRLEIDTPRRPLRRWIMRALEPHFVDAAVLERVENAADEIAAEISELTYEVD